MRAWMPPRSPGGGCGASGLPARGCPVAPRTHVLRQHQRFEQLLTTELKGENDLTRKENGTLLARSGIEAAALQLGYLLIHAELEGLICSGPRRGKQQTYALLDERVPAATIMDRVSAPAELAGCWRSTPRRGVVRIEALLDVPFDPAQHRALRTAAEQYAEFLGLTADVTTVELRSEMEKHGGRRHTAGPGAVAGEPAAGTGEAVRGGV